MRKLATVSAAIALSALALAGCSTNDNPVDASDVVVDTPAPSDIVVDDSTTTPDVVVESEKPHAITDTVTVGDWDVKITKVTKNANRLIDHYSNREQKPDVQYVLVTYAATYHGTDREGSIYDLRWNVTTKDQTVHTVDDDVIDQSEQGDWPYETRPGGTLKGDAVFDVDPSKIELITVEIGYDGDYADFAL